MSVFAFLPIDSTKDSLDTATAITASTTIETNKEEDSFDLDNDSTTTTTYTYTSSTETKAAHYVDTEHYTVTSDLEVWNYRR